MTQYSVKGYGHSGRRKRKYWAIVYWSKAKNYWIEFNPPIRFKTKSKAEDYLNNTEAKKLTDSVWETDLSFEWETDLSFGP